MVVSLYLVYLNSLLSIHCKQEPFLNHKGYLWLMLVIEAEVKPGPGTEITLTTAAAAGAAEKISK